MPEARKKVAAKKTTTKAPKKRVSVAAPKTKLTEATKPKKTAAGKKKPAAKKAVTAKPKTPQAKKPVAKVKKTTKAKLPPKKTEVVLPTRMSIRAREKALALSEQFEASFQKFAYPAAMALGFCFVLLGSYATFTLTHFSTMCAANECKAEAIDPMLQNEDSTASSLEPQVMVVAAIPPLLTSDFELLLDTIAVSQMEVHLVYQNQEGINAKLPLAVNALGNEKYAVLIPVSTLEPNQYAVRVRTWAPGTIEAQTFMVGGFSIEGPVATAGAGATQDVADEVTTADSLTNDPAAADVDATIQTATPDNSSLPIAENTMTNDAVRTTESTTEIIPPTEIPTQEPADNLGFQIALPSPLQGTAPVALQTTGQYTSGQAVIKRLFVAEPVASINLAANQKQFFITSTAYPNGSYKLVVTLTSPTGITLQRSQEFVIFNPLVQSATTDETIQIETDRPILTIRNTLAKDPAGETDSAATEPIQPQERVEDPLRLRAQAQLRDNSEVIDDLLARYAAAVQVGDQDMIRAAKAAIEAYRAEIIRQTLVSETDRFIADEYAVQLDDELAALTKRVETFETIRRERLEGDSAIDTDGDGISDIDERVLFKSNPLLADTDGDGFTDGAEIINGFDPINPKPEAAIVYRSPKETVGIAPNANLQVAEVLPVINVAAEEPAVHTTVRGKGLPNSFVTLYVYSTPTIVTVKTDADGAFEYTFSKELEDGEHQVFVALTDNTGDIVAQSAPFTFIKEAQAFTPVDAEASATTLETATPADNSDTLYRTVLAMAVLALGVLLILLGVGLRSNRPELITVASST